MSTASTPLSGRRAEAARNDQRILDAARAVFVADPGAPIAAAEEALADDGDPWEGFARFMRRAVDADTHSLTARLAGTFTPTDDLNRAAGIAQELSARLVERARAAGAIRDDLDVNDLSMVFEQLASIRLGDEARTRQLRHRYLALLLEAMHGPSGSRLPGPPPTWRELTARW